jgi:putative transcriptional regulator
MAKTRVRNNIRQLRFANDEMTQQRLAEIVGVTRQTIVAIEKEKYSPSLEAAFKIAAALDASFDSVFSYDAIVE